MNKKEVLQWLKDHTWYTLIENQEVSNITLTKMIESGVAHYSFIEHYVIKPYNKQNNIKD
jgi:hypothetical protein